MTFKPGDRVRVTRAGLREAPNLFLSAPLLVIASAGGGKILVQPEGRNETATILPEHLERDDETETDRRQRDKP